MRWGLPSFGWTVSEFLDPTAKRSRFKKLDYARIYNYFKTPSSESDTRTDVYGHDNKFASDSGLHYFTTFPGILGIAGESDTSVILYRPNTDRNYKTFLSTTPMAADIDRNCGGIWEWEVSLKTDKSIARPRASGGVASKCLDFFVGVCESTVGRDSYIGSDDKGWGMYGKNLTRFHAKSSRKLARDKQTHLSASSRSFGDGDTVLVRYNSVEGAMHFGVNGQWNSEPQFTGIGKSKDKRASDKVLFPAVSLYKRGSEAALRLISFTPIACERRALRGADPVVQQPRMIARLLLRAQTVHAGMNYSIVCARVAVKILFRIFLEKKEEAAISQEMTRFAHMLVRNGTRIDCDSEVDGDTPALGNRDVCAQMLQWLCAPTCMDSSLPPLLQLLQIETSRFLRGRSDVDASEMDPQFLRDVLVASLLVCDLDAGEHPTNVELWTKCVTFGITHAVAYIMFRQKLLEDGVEIRNHTGQAAHPRTLALRRALSFGSHIQDEVQSVCTSRPNVILAMLVFEALREAGWLTDPQGDKMRLSDMDLMLLAYMARGLLLIALALAQSPADASLEDVGSASVVELSPTNYDEVVLRGGGGDSGHPAVGGRHGTLVKFYAPWCKHCRALVKPWRILAGSCAAYADTLEAAGDSAAFPHIRYVEGDNLSVDYMGTRSLTDLVIFAEMQTGIGPFEGVGGMTRLKAYGIRYLLSVLQFVMETNNDTGPKPSLQTMITMCVLFAVPVLGIGGCAMTCLYVGFFREGGSGKRLSKDDERDPLGPGGTFDESRQRHEKHD
eukprot:g2655.t1